jgi:transposase, IS30 family
MQYKHLSIEERETIQTLYWEKKSVRAIARNLGRPASCVSRELKRNFPPERKVYTPRLAHERALRKRTSRGRTDRLKNHTIRSYVIEKLKLRWSPEQIAGRIRIDLKKCISHEAIYQFIYHQITREGYGRLKEGYLDLRLCLRRKQKRRQRKGMRRSQRVLRPKGISIDDRPLIVSTRIRFGDWEGDTVESKDHKPGVNTLLERKSGLYLVTKVKDKSGIATANVVAKRMSVLPKKYKRTLTLDNGTENSEWNTIEETTGLKTFYAHPYHSWERGGNENANGLLRDYFPKGTDFTLISDDELAAVEYALNTRPRKRLNWKTPLEVIGVALRG